MTKFALSLLRLLVFSAWSVCIQSVSAIEISRFGSSPVFVIRALFECRRRNMPKWRLHKLSGNLGLINLTIFQNDAWPMAIIFSASIKVTLSCSLFFFFFRPLRRSVCSS